MAIVGLWLMALQTVSAGAFDFEAVADLARSQAQQPYRPVERKPPAELQALDYDQYRDIRFRPDHALWRAESLPFELMFFHLGKFQTEPVRINEITPAACATSAIEAPTSTMARTSSRRRVGRCGLRRFSRSLSVER